MDPDSQDLQLEHIVCNLCGSGNYSNYLQLADRYTNDKFQLVTCDNCGLVYVNPRPSVKDLAYYYPEEYEPHSQDSFEHSGWHQQRMWHKQLNFIEGYHQSKGSLLDIGCATGDFLAVAQKNGWTVRGVELDPEAVHIARNRYGLDVINEAAENIPQDTTYDVITMWNVLEHLYDPRAALLRCHSLLQSEGWLFFSIPNLRSFDRSIFKGAWLGWEVPRHLYYFSEQTIGRLLTEIGFGIVEVRCFLGGRGVIELSLRTKYARSRGLSIVNSLMPVILTLTWPYRQISYLLNRGSIITYIVRKE